MNFEREFVPPPGYFIAAANGRICGIAWARYGRVSGRARLRILCQMSRPIFRMFAYEIH